MSAFNNLLDQYSNRHWSSRMRLHNYCFHIEGLHNIHHLHHSPLGLFHKDWQRYNILNRNQTTSLGHNLNFLVPVKYVDRIIIETISSFLKFNINNYYKISSKSVPGVDVQTK